MKINRHAPVLLVGPPSKLSAALSSELRACHLGVSTLAQLSDRPEHAGSSSFSNGAAALLLPESLVDTESFEAELAALRIRTGAAGLTPIVLGRRPDVARRGALRDIGIELALFGRFGRHALRFQVNRALSPNAIRHGRGTLRAPMEWRARTFASGKEKAVRCYSLSTDGAYLVTPRPWVVGTQIQFELPIDGRDRQLEAKILYTNAGESSNRPNLPGGMAIRFEGISTGLRSVLERDLHATRYGLEV